MVDFSKDVVQSNGMRATFVQEGKGGVKNKYRFAVLISVPHKWLAFTTLFAANVVAFYDQNGNPSNGTYPTIINA